MLKSAAQKDAKIPDTFGVIKELHVLKLKFSNFVLLKKNIEINLCDN